MFVAGFAPLVHNVRVTDKPLGSLNFKPVKADIEGKVQCLGKKGCSAHSIEVTLSLEGSASQTSKVNNAGELKFTGVLPATYTLSISEGGICWEKQEQKISVSKDVKDIVFKQIGKYISVDTTRSTLLQINDLNAKLVQEVQLGKDFQDFLLFPDSYLQFFRSRHKYNLRQQQRTSRRLSNQRMRGIRNIPRHS